MSNKFIINIPRARRTNDRASILPEVAPLGREDGRTRRAPLLPLGAHPANGPTVAAHVPATLEDPLSRGALGLVLGDPRKIDLGLVPDLKESAISTLLTGGSRHIKLHWRKGNPSAEP